MLPTLNAQQLAQAKAIKRNKGRYYTEESFRKAVDAELKRFDNHIMDKLLAHYTVASAFAILDELELTTDQLMRIFKRTNSMYEEMTRNPDELSFKQQRDQLYEETGIFIELDQESLIWQE